ncbi:MAG: PIN domain-containing protein [Patescibacteria group bacterium]|nr:PIN domain-containing protein [Patescibacteria group bacterium]
MKYLLDTDIIINHLKGKQSLNAKILSGELFISIITYGELLYGAYKSLRINKSLDTISDFLRDFSIKILTLEQATMKEYAQNKVLLEKKGTKLDNFDLLIASTAKVNSCRLITKNLKHFQRFPGLTLG